MAAILWWRSWHGAPTDPKWMVIARNANSRPGVVSAVAWALFDYASQNTPRGSITGFDIETYSVFSGFDEYEIGSIINCMEDKKLIIDGMLSDAQKFNIYPNNGEIPFYRKEWNKERGKIEKAVYEKYNHRCARCGSTYKLSIDHIRPLSKGGSNKPENLQVLCRKCNSRKGAKWQTSA